MSEYLNLFIGSDFLAGVFFGLFAFGEFYFLFLRKKNGRDDNTWGGLD